MTHQKTCIYTGPPPHLPKALRRQESTELVKRDLFLHRSQEGFGSHQEPKGQYRRGGFWVWTQETSTGSVCAGDTFIFLDSYFVHPASVSPLTQKLLASFLSQTVPPIASLRPNPQFRGNRQTLEQTKGPCSPQLFAGTPLPPSLAPAEQNQMPTCGRRQRAGSIPGPLSRSGLLPETPDAMRSKESPLLPHSLSGTRPLSESLSVSPRAREPGKPCSLSSHARHIQASRKAILGGPFADEKLEPLEVMLPSPQAQLHVT